MKFDYWAEPYLPLAEFTSIDFCVSYGFDEFEEYFFSYLSRNCLRDLFNDKYKPKPFYYKQYIEYLVITGVSMKYLNNITKCDYSKIKIYSSSRAISPRKFMKLIEEKMKIKLEDIYKDDFYIYNKMKSLYGDIEAKEAKEEKKDVIEKKKGDVMEKVMDIEIKITQKGDTMDIETKEEKEVDVIEKLFAVEDFKKECDIVFNEEFKKYINKISNCDSKFISVYEKAANNYFEKFKNDYDFDFNKTFNDYIL